MRMLACLCRRLSSAPPVEGRPLSRRAQFRQIRPDMGLVDRLDRLELGFCARKARRVSVAIKRRALTGRGEESFEVEVVTAPGQSSQPDKPRSRSRELPGVPYPFNYGVYRADRLAEAAEFADAPSFDGKPPEVAIIGRSNVGKSTLLNALLGFNSHVQSSKVTSKPGETKQLKFYSMGLRWDEQKKASNAALVIVDMPGYGFAYMKEEDSLRCDRLMKDYLRHRGPVLKRVLLVLDARHGVKLTDMEFFRHLAADLDSDEVIKRYSFGWKLQLVLTKSDLVERFDLARRIQLLNQKMSELLPGFSSSLPILAISGKERKGVVELQRELAALVPPKLKNNDDAEVTTSAL